MTHISMAGCADFKYMMMVMDARTRGGRRGRQPNQNGREARGRVAADGVGRWGHGCVAGGRHADRWCCGQHRRRANGCRAVGWATSE